MRDLWLAFMFAGMCAVWLWVADRTAAYDLTPGPLLPYIAAGASALSAVSLAVGWARGRRRR